MENLLAVHFQERENKLVILDKSSTDVSTKFQLNCAITKTLMCETLSSSVTLKNCTSLHNMENKYK